VYLYLDTLLSTVLLSAKDTHMFMFSTMASSSIPSRNPKVLARYTATARQKCVACASVVCVYVCALRTTC